jgi:hypothetical protein
MVRRMWSVRPWSRSAAARKPAYVEKPMACSHAECLRMGVCSWDFAAAVSEDLIEITGTEGQLALSVFGNEPVRLATAAHAEQFDLPIPCTSSSR